MFSRSTVQSPAILKKGDGSSKVGFKHSLVSTYVRSVLDKLDDLVSLKDVGNVGLGGDDTGTIQTFINLSAKGLYIPEGTYNFTALTLKANCRYVGAGMDATKLAHTGGAVVAIYGEGSFIQIECMTLSGNGVNTTKTLSLKNAYFMSWIKNVRVEQGVVNVALESSWTFTIDTCHIRGAGNDVKGITQNNLVTDGWEAGVIKNSRLEDCLGDNIEIDQILGPATNFFTITETKLQRCGGRALSAKVGQGRLNVYIERANDNNALDLPIIDFLAGGFTKIENTYITNSGALSKAVKFAGNTLILDNVYQSASGGAKGLDIDSATAQVIQLGGRILGVSTVPNAVAHNDFSQLSKTQLRDGSLLLGVPANLDSTLYAVDIEATNKNTRIVATGNFKQIKDNPANRRNDTVYQSAGVDKIYTGRGDSDELGDSVWYVGAASNTPILSVNVLTGVLKISNCPTSSAGLVAGEIYRNGNILEIV